MHGTAGREDVPGSLPLGAAVLAVLLPIAAGACSNSFGIEDSDSAVIFGRVTALPGEPVPGARIDVTAFSGICSSNVFSSVSTRSDSTGRYATTVIDFRRRRNSCLEVQATPPEGAGLQSRMVRLPSVSLSGDGVDSLRVDLALDSAGSG